MHGIDAHGVAALPYPALVRRIVEFASGTGAGPFRTDLVKALNDAVTYCDGVYGGMTDAAAMELVKAGQNLVPKARFLITNISHDNEHYGNLVVYYRLNALVPPASRRTRSVGSSAISSNRERVRL